MQRSRRPKSAVRKPLADLLIPPNPNPSVDPNPALHRLQLARSDLASVFAQIDQLVAQAISQKTISKKGSQEIDSFRNMLSDINSSLKPWTSRLQQAFANASSQSVGHPNYNLDKTSDYGATGFSDTAPSIETETGTETERELIVSPSPLVSWHADSSTVDCGRQLFLLTPLPNSKLHSTKVIGSSKSVTINFSNEEQSNCHNLPLTSKSTKNADSNLLGRVELSRALKNVQVPFSFQQQFVASDRGHESPVIFSNHKSRTFRLLTPYMPRSSAALDAISESCEHSGENNLLKLEDNSNSDKVFDGPNSEDISLNYPSNYPDLLGYQPGSRFRRKGVAADETLDWFLSPPKTCVLMEPSDVKPLPTPPDTRLAVVTPAWKGLESTRKQPGEATLKRELWTQFEAVSSSELQFDASIFQKTGGKGFLDRLEEVSFEAEDSSAQTER